MNWFALALIGHISNGVTFTIDKILLRSAFTRSATYAGIVGTLSSILLIAIPFVDNWPYGYFWLAAIVSGITFIIALWAFFGALGRAEASRIVPIVGSLIPILTLAGSFVFLGERLQDKTFFGFALLILATIILSGGGKGRPSKEAVWLAVTAAFLFAISSVTAKASYDATGFFGPFVVSRIAAATTALFLLLFLDRAAGQEVLSIIRPNRKQTSKHKRPSRTSVILALMGQVLGATGFLFVQWATAKGSASIVNAMQAVQYALLVIVALILKHKAPKLLGENLTRRVLVIKISALLITAIGMYLIV
ncbi:MAG: EamA family transporter [Patescibacteria group bacterium]